MIRVAALVAVIVAIAVIVPTWFVNTYRNSNTATSNELAGQLPTAEQAVKPAKSAQSAPTPSTSAAYTGRTIRLTMDSRGHFIADFRLNGRNTRALVDTGATTVAINASTARQIGITLSERDFSHRVSTANGETRAALTTIANIEIGRISAQNVQAMVLDDQALDQTLLGMSFLKTLGRFEVSGDTLTLTQ